MCPLVTNQKKRSPWFRELRIVNLLVKLVHFNAFKQALFCSVPENCLTNKISPADVCRNVIKSFAKFLTFLVLKNFCGIICLVLWTNVSRSYFMQRSTFNSLMRKSKVLTTYRKNIVRTGNLSENCTLSCTFLKWIFTKDKIRFLVFSGKKFRVRLDLIGLFDYVPLINDEDS